MNRRMPRASKEVGEEKKRAPRRQVATRAPRKVATGATKASEAKATPEVTSLPSRRKAPTKLPVSPASPIALYEASRSKKSLFISGSLLMLGLIVAAGVGYSDKGVINTAAVISERNAQLASGITSTEPGSTSMVVPVQNSASGKIDGGLVSSGEVPPLVPSNTEVATTTSSSTEMATTTATTTDESLDQEVLTSEETASGEVVAETGQ